MTASENDRPRVEDATAAEAAEVSALSKNHAAMVGGKPKLPPMRKVHMGGAFTKNATAAVEVLLWIIYEGKKSAIDSSCASNGFGGTYIIV